MIEIDAKSAVPIQRMIDILVEEGASRKAAQTYLALSYDLGRKCVKTDTITDTAGNILSPTDAG